MIYSQSIYILSQLKADGYSEVEVSYKMRYIYIVMLNTFMIGYSKRPGQHFGQKLSLLIGTCRFMVCVFTAEAL